MMEAKMSGTKRHVVKCQTIAYVKMIPDNFVTRKGVERWRPAGDREVGEEVHF